MHSPGHVAATDELAREQLFPHHAEAFGRIGRERGWGPYSRETFDAGATPQGALFVGSPETVAQKIAWAVRTLGLSRFQLKYAVGSLPHEQRMESIRLYGTEVILNRPGSDGGSQSMEDECHGSTQEVPRRAA